MIKLLTAFVIKRYFSELKSFVTIWCITEYSDCGATCNRTAEVLKNEKKKKIIIESTKSTNQSLFNIVLYKCTRNRLVNNYYPLI